MIHTIMSHTPGNELWTARMSPGIAQLADDLDSIGDYLAPLITFAKQSLIASKDNYGDIPIYFYATGGVRLLSAKKRDEVIDTVRDYLNNDTNCPFFFHEDFARVISGKYCTADIIHSYLIERFSCTAVCVLWMISCLLFIALIKFRSCCSLVHFSKS